MKKNFIVLMAFLVFVACAEPEPRKPVQRKSGSFFKASVERSKQLLAFEEKQIKKIQEKDSLKNIKTSKYGFSYYYENGPLPSNYNVQPDDEIVIAYNLMSLEGDTIYTQEEIGRKTVKVDKTKLFPGLRNGLKLLKEGEKISFFFPSSQAFGYKGDNKRIGSNVPLKSSVELLQILKRKDSLNQQ